jgi:NADH-quinone oxidoreductase subunit A
MPFDFAQVLIFMVLAVGFVVGALTLQRLVAPSAPSADKGEIYECGERPIGDAWFNFNPRFYIVALIFVIFDVEIALTIPVAVVFKAWTRAGAGVPAFLELMVFVLILLAGLAYVWKKGDLEWIKRLRHDPDSAKTSSLQSAPKSAGV